MTIELLETARFAEQAKVMDLFVSNENPTTIAKKLGIKRTDVIQHIDDWKTSNAGTKFLQDRVEELIALLDSHYSKLIREMYEVVEEANRLIQVATLKEATGLLGQKNAALSKIADFEAKRVDTLQKAGLLEAADLGDQFVDQEEKQQLLLAIIREVSYDCAHCRVEVSNRISQITGKAETMPDNDIVNGN